MIHLVLAGLLAVTPIPAKPRTWVTDGASLLSARTRGALESRLWSYWKRHGPEVIVWTTRELPDEPRYVWCFRAFDSWAIGNKGSKGQDDGVALFVFANGPKYCWIVTGAGLTQVITNAEAVRICREVVAPAVRASRAEEGIVGAVAAILKALDGRGGE